MKDDTTALRAKDDTAALPAKEDTEALHAKDDTTALRAKDDTAALPAKEDTEALHAKDDTTALPAKEDTQRCAYRSAALGVLLGGLRASEARPRDSPGAGHTRPAHGLKPPSQRVRVGFSRRGGPPATRSPGSRAAATALHGVVAVPGRKGPALTRRGHGHCDRRSAGQGRRHARHRPGLPSDDAAHAGARHDADTQGRRAGT